jgi:hypothetical protein
MEAGESHAFFGLDLFVAIEWSDLHLRTLQGWQVLLFTFESATSSVVALSSWFLNCSKVIFCRYVLSMHDVC